MNPTEFNLNLRNANADDSKNIFNWRNDLTTRKMSINQAPVKWSDHANWIKKTIASPDEFLLIGEIDGSPIGLIRFTSQSQTNFLVSINMNPDYRGMGLGKSLLKSGISWAKGHLHNIQNIYAEIKLENKVSIATFESCEFKKISEHDSGKLIRYVYKIKS